MLRSSREGFWASLVLLGLVLTLSSWSTPVAAQAPLVAKVAGLYAMSTTTVQTGPQRAAMARLAVEFIREDPTFNSTIDFQVRFDDDRGDLTQSFINALDAVQNGGYKMMVGPNRSGQSQLVSAVGAAFKVPLVSYASSSPSLSSKSDYAYFFRTCPSDNQQAKVWVSIMQHYDWKQCAVLASNDAYGSGVSSAFLNLATQAGISVSTVSYFAPSDHDMTGALEAVRASKAKIIILAAIAGGGGRITLKQAVLAKMMGSDSGFTWILAEGSASPALLLAASTESETTLSNANFRTGLLGNIATKPRGGAGALWDSLIDTWVNGGLNTTLYPGSGSTNIVTTDVYVPYSVDAMYTVAHAFRKLAQQNLSLSGGNLTKVLKETDFVGVTGRVRFDTNQDRNVPYAILNIRDTTNFFEAYGEWSVDAITLSGEAIWPDGTTQVPGDGLPRTLYWIRWNHPAAIVFLILVAICIVICAATAIIVLRFADTPVMRLASPWFLVVTLVGLALFFSSLVPWFGTPQSVSCILRNWLGHLGFCLAIAAIIAKTYRVDVIFRRRKKIKRIIVTNFELFKYVAIIISPMLILLVIWTAIDRPKTKNVIDIDNKRINVVCASKSPAWLIAAFVYDAFLMCLSLFLSFRTRRVPDGFNETWYIYLSGYNTIIMGILGVTLGYVLNKNLLALTIIVCVTLLVGGFVIWGLLFLPKLYIALITPEQNNAMLKSSRTRTSPSMHTHSVAELHAWHSSGNIQVSSTDENRYTSKTDSKKASKTKDSVTDVTAVDEETTVSPATSPSQTRKEKKPKRAPKEDTTAEARDEPVQRPKKKKKKVELAPPDGAGAGDAEEN